jgi:nicotinate-nucleotide pyrophosphorylase (carboxylating)
MNADEFIRLAIEEDLKDPEGKIPYGDHATFSTIPPDVNNAAYAVAKEPGILAGIELAQQIFNQIDSSLKFSAMVKDGHKAVTGDVLFEVSGSARSILMGERLALNFMQRMSGIATLTSLYVDAVKGTGVKILDTRKTTPNMRYFEKMAVKIGGGCNHRFGLYDMIMIKDNHIDFCGGIEKAILRANDYLKVQGFTVPVEVETRSLHDVEIVLRTGGVQRLMLDNFTVEEVKQAVKLIDGKIETEVSGGINLNTIRAYAEARPDYISVGALTHSYKSMDISLKAQNI